MTAHLRLYNADGVLLTGGILPDHEGLGVQQEHNGTGSFAVNYSKAGKGAALIDSDNAFVGVVVDGVERPDRYLLEEDGDDPTDKAGRARPIAVGGRGVMALLEWAEVYPKDYVPGMTGAALYNLEPLHAFADSTPGAIIATFIDRAKQRSLYDGAAGAKDGIRLINYDFTSTHDSAGQPWPTTYSVSYEAGLDLLKVLLAACDNYMCDARMEGFTLRLFVPDTVYGTDRPDVILRAGREVTGGPRKRSRRPIRSHMLAIGDEGAIVERVNATARARYGRREGYEARSGVTAIDTLTRLADAALDGVSDASEGFTVECDLTAEGPQPGADYEVGQRIRYDRRRLSETEYEPMRVRTIATSWDKNGNQSASLELNDLFVEAEVRLQRKVDGIVNGSSSNSRAPKAPGDTANDRLAPKVPAACAIATGTFLRNDGTIGASATISWPAVTQNVDGTVYDDAGNYLLSYRTHPTNALLGEWTSEQIVRTEQVYVDNVNPGWKMQARVHTIDSSGNVEQETDGTTKLTYSPIITVVEDTDAPPVPSAPAIDDETFPGGLKVTWDGLGSAGEAMPLDLRAVEVHASTASNFVPSPSTLRDTMPYGGGVTVVDSPVGVVTYIVLVAVDNTGNRSNPSAQVSGEGRGVNAAEIAAEINAAITQAGTDAGAAQATANAAQASAATAIANAATGQSTANAAQSAAAAAASAATAAQATATNAATAAATAQAAADAAALAAQGATVTYFQANPPAGGTEGDLWIETDNGNRLYVFTGGQWTVAADQTITAAQAAAAAAQATADAAAASAATAATAASTAQARADSAFGAAGTAQAAANAAQSTASAANAAAATAQAAAVAAAADAAAALNANPNLYLNSSFEKDVTGGVLFNATATYPGPAMVHGARNLRVTRTATSTIAGGAYIIRNDGTMDVPASAFYGKGPVTVSWTERSNAVTTGVTMWVVEAGSANTVAQSTGTSTVATRKSLTFTPANNVDLRLVFTAGGLTADDWTEYDAVKVEVGGKATAWTLNPQEAVDAAAAAKTAADTAQTTANTANNAAAAAQSSANTAIANAATAQSTAASAQSAASAAQGSANTALTNASTAQTAATNAQTAANNAAAQAAAALAANPNIFVGSSFEDPVAAVAVAQNTGNAVTSDTVRAWHGTRSLKVVANDTGDRYIEKTVTVEPNTDYAVSIYSWVPAGTTNAQIPVNGANGNLLWVIDYANGTNIKIAPVSLAATNVWQRATTTIKTGAGTTSLALRLYAATGGIWFDALKVEKGTVATAWSLNPQEAIDAAAAAKAAAATAQSRADSAFNNAQTAQDAATAASSAAGIAQGQATTALNTANGKGKTYFQGTPPVGAGLTTNDVWFNTSADNQPSSWNGSSWVLQRFGNSAILAGLDAGKITVGTLSALVIGAKSISVEKLSIGSLSDSLILNGSFEDATDLLAPSIAAGWNTYSGATRVSGYSRSGAWSVSAPQSTSACLEGDRFTASPGDVFYIAAWAYFAAASGGFYLRMQWLNTALAEIGISDAYGGAQPTSTAYALYSGTTLAAPAGTAYARVQVYSTNTSAIIDDVACNKVIVTAQIGDNQITAAKVVAQSVSTEKLTVGAFSQSLVRNGSFEDTGIPIDNVDPGGINAARWSGQWSAGCSTYTEANQRGSGQRTLVLYTNNNANQSLATSDYFPVLGGGTYFGSVGACQTSGATGGFYFRVHWYDTAKTFISSVDIANYATLPTQSAINGNRVSGQVVAPANAAYANVRFYNSGPSIGTYMILDDVTFQQVTISAQIGNGAVTANKVATTEFDAMIARIDHAIITEAMIASATITRLTAGNLNVLATLTAGGKITTGGSAGRVEWDASGIRAYAADGVSKTVEILSATGSATFTGTLRTGFSGRRIELINNNDATWLGLSMNFYSLASMTADPPRVTAIDTGLDVAGYDPMQLILDGGLRSDIGAWTSSQVILSGRSGGGIYGSMSGATYVAPVSVVGNTVTIDPKTAAGTWGSYDHSYHELNMYDVIRFQSNVNSQFGGLRFYNYNGVSGELKQWERRRVLISRTSSNLGTATLTWEGFFTARPVTVGTYEQAGANVSNDVCLVYSNNTTSCTIRLQDVDAASRTLTNTAASVIATL